MEAVALAALGTGLVNVGSGDPEVSATLLRKLLELGPSELSDAHSNFLPLSLGMVYMGCRDAIEASSAALEVLPEPYRLASQTMLQAMFTLSRKGRTCEYANAFLTDMRLRRHR